VRVADPYVSACRIRPIKALAPKILAALEQKSPDIGVELILAPFMQQADLCTGAREATVRFCRISGEFDWGPGIVRLRLAEWLGASAGVTHGNRMTGQEGPRCGTVRGTAHRIIPA
jgi:hypothetical protein